MASVSTDLGERTARRRPGRPKGSGVVADRAQILAAATAVIRERGPDVTMDDIATAANVTKPIVYRTVGDRAALTSALSENLVDRITAAVAATSIPTEDPAAGFTAVVRGFLDAVASDRNVYLFVNSSTNDVEQNRRMIERSAQEMIAMFNAALERRGRDQSAALTWSYAIVGAFQTVTLMWLRDEFCDIDAVADDLATLLWPGVARAFDDAH